MKMLVRQLDHINVSVDDFEQSADFYGRLFGFDIVEEAETDGVRWGVLKAGDALLCIHQRKDLTSVDRFGLLERGLHVMAHFALRIDDEAAWRHCIT